jgi:hypothetical protein
MMASDAMIFESENGKVWRRADGALTWDFKDNSSRVSSLVLDLAAELEKTRAELATRVWPLAEVQESHNNLIKRLTRWLANEGCGFESDVEAELRRMFAEELEATAKAVEQKMEE